MLFGNQDGYLQQGKPQENQYLTGDPSISENNQTDWMKPTDLRNSGFSGYGGGQQQQQSQPVAGNGTALDAMINGGFLNLPPMNQMNIQPNQLPGSGGGFGANTNNLLFANDGQTNQQASGEGQFNPAGQQNQQFANGWQPTAGGAPPGFDQAKWADTTGSTSNKYTVGRIMASGGSIQDAAAAVGGQVVGGDKIQYPDGFVADVIYDLGGPNQRIQYTDVTDYGQGGGQQMGNQQQGQPQSYMGQQQPMDYTSYMKNILNQMFQGQQADRQMFQQGRPNMSGGFGQMPPNPIGGGGFFPNSMPPIPSSNRFGQGQQQNNPFYPPNQSRRRF